VGLLVRTHTLLSYHEASFYVVDGELVESGMEGGESSLVEEEDGCFMEAAANGKWRSHG